MKETALVSAVNSSSLDEPTNFKEAWHHPDVEERGKWREAIKKEFRDMTNRGVWRKQRGFPSRLKDELWDVNGYSR